MHRIVSAHASFLFLLLGSSALASASSRIGELSNETTDENFGEGSELLWLNLVVVVRVNAAEHGVDVLVSDGHSDVVVTEEVAKELAELTPVQESIVVVIVLREVLHHLLGELRLVTIEGLELSKGGLEFTLLKVCWVDHFAVVV